MLFFLMVESVTRQWNGWRWWHYLCRRNNTIRPLGPIKLMQADTVISKQVVSSLQSFVLFSDSVMCFVGCFFVSLYLDDLAAFQI